MHRIVSPAFQPIVDDESGEVLYFEALARVRLGEGGHGRLIEMGEEFGFVHLIDGAMLQHAATALTEDARAIVAVNVSAVTLQRSLGELLATLFRNIPVAPRLIFEVTETARITDMAAVGLFVDAVRLLGARIAFDDFGSGFLTSSLVKAFRPDYVKLAGSLLLDAVRLEATVAEVARLVSAYGGEIIAEHVDSEEKRNQLRSLQVRYMQGFLFGRPTAQMMWPLAHGRDSSCASTAPLALQAG